MKLLLTLFLVTEFVTAEAQTAAQCKACAEAAVNHPTYLKYAAGAKYQQVDAHKAAYIASGLMLKYCNQCDEYGDFNQIAEQHNYSAENIKKLGGALPPIPSDFKYNLSDPNKKFTGYKSKEDIEHDEKQQKLIEQDKASVKKIQNNFSGKKLNSQPGSTQANKYETVSLDELPDLPVEEAPHNNHAGAKPLPKKRTEKNDGEARKEELRVAKESILLSTGQKILSKKGRRCSSGFSEVKMLEVFTGEKSIHSIDAMMPWSIWIPLQGTSLEIRYSQKRVCTPILPNQMIDSFFDYGFFQLRNTAGETASGKIIYQSVTEEGENYTGQEPFYLQADETMEEELGNWFLGCKLISVKVQEFCTQP